MDLSNSSKSMDILVIGYKYSAVDLIQKTIVKLCTRVTPITVQNTVPHITCCEGHLPSQYPHLNISQVTKVIYIVRNPKDIAASLYKNSQHQHDIHFSDYLTRFIKGMPDDNWCGHTKEWSTLLSQHPTCNLHLIYFDDLIQDFDQEVSTLCQFLNVQKNSVQISELCMLVRKEADQPQQKRRKTNHTENGHSRIEIFNDTGAWKSLFTVTLAEQMDIFMFDELKDTNLDLNRLLCPSL